MSGLEIEPVAQILARLQDAHQKRAVGFARHHRFDQIELVHRDQLQDLGAEVSGAIARQGLHHLDMFRRPDAPCRGEFAVQLRFERGVVGLDKGIKPDAAAPVGERDNGGIADGRIFPDQSSQQRGVVDQPPAAAFAV